MLNWIRSILGRQRYGIKMLTDERKRMAKFPELSRRLDSLESRIRILEQQKINSNSISNYQD